MKNHDSKQRHSDAAQPLPYGRGSGALHAFAVATMVATFVLIIVGGIVTTRGAGLAVPDWPLSYGQLMPERWYAMANIAAEHGHRMIAAVVGIMMLGLAIHTQCVTLIAQRDATFLVRDLLKMAEYGYLSES